MTPTPRSPWGPESVVLAVVLQALSLGAGIVGWRLVSDGVDADGQLPYVVLTIGALMLSATANALWLLAGRRAIVVRSADVPLTRPMRSSP